MTPADEDEYVLPAVPTDGEQALTAELGAERLQEIDEALVRHAATRWQKVAMVVYGAWKASGVTVMTDSHLDLYVRRVIGLVDAGVFEGAGNLRRPRWSEVRLRASPTA